MNTIQLQMDGSIYAAFGSYAIEKKTTVQQLLMNYINQLIVEDNNRKATIATQAEAKKIEMSPELMSFMGMGQSTDMRDWKQQKEEYLDEKFAQ